ncbi:hypothetical protein RCG67_00265 [Kocuria sp. CPCC 205292]|uniref:hypothetical protein n=1 Tax=Kocuria cellulosilytica TaxID=3071451 RepID=UPI0034D47196
MSTAGSTHLSDGLDEHELELCPEHLGRAQAGEDCTVVIDDAPVVLMGENHPWNLIASSATYRTEPHRGVVLKLTMVRRGESADLDVFVSPDEAEVLTGLLNSPAVEAPHRADRPIMPAHGSDGWCVPS